MLVSGATADPWLFSGSSLLESTQPSSVVPYTDWPGQLPAADPGPVDAGSMDGLQQVEDECVFAAKLGLQVRPCCIPTCDTIAPYLRETCPTCFDT